MRTETMLKALSWSFFSLGGCLGLCSIFISEEAQYHTLFYMMALTSLFFLGMAWLLMEVKEGFKRVYNDACRFKHQRDYLRKMRG